MPVASVSAWKNPCAPEKRLWAKPKVSLICCVRALNPASVLSLIACVFSRSCVLSSSIWSVRLMTWSMFPDACACASRPSRPARCVFRMPPRC
jgi:hypothetical protein